MTRQKNAVEIANLKAEIERLNSSAAQLKKEVRSCSQQIKFIHLLAGQVHNCTREGADQGRQRSRENAAENGVFEGQSEAVAARKYLFQDC